MTIEGQILVIDDERGLREGCRRALTRHGLSVDVAATGREGLDKIQEGAFDLVLLDVMMPDISGIELLDIMRARDPDIVCIIITGYATVELAVQAMKMGAYDFIAKPFSDDNLLLAVQKGLEKRQLERESRRLQRVEEEAKRLSRDKDMLEELDRVKSAFMRRVAHELRAPIAAIESLMNSIIGGFGSPDTQRLMQERAAGRAHELLLLLDDLLDLSRLKDAKIESRKREVCVESILRDVLNLHGPEAASKKLSLDVDCQACPAIIADPDHIRQLWTNLISNAIKYTGEGGQIAVSLYAENGAIIGKVEDTGIGMTPEEMARLFEEFFRTDHAKLIAPHGTGLGLSIVKQIVDEYGGRISVDSAIGEGSCFTFYLPTSQPEEDS